jgi:hypothetical protein
MGDSSTYNLIVAAHPYVLGCVARFLLLKGANQLTAKLCPHLSQQSTCPMAGVPTADNRPLITCKHCFAERVRDMLVNGCSIPEAADQVCWNMCSHAPGRDCSKCVKACMFQLAASLLSKDTRKQLAKRDKEADVKKKAHVSPLSNYSGITAYNPIKETS